MVRYQGDGTDYQTVDTSGGFDPSQYLSYLPTLLGLGGALFPNSPFFRKPVTGQTPPVEPPGWQALRATLLGSLLQNYFGAGYSTPPATGVPGFPSQPGMPTGNMLGGAGAPAAGFPAGGPTAGPTPVPFAGGGGGGVRGVAPKFAGRRIPGRPRPPWQMQAPVPQTQPGITPAYSGEELQAGLMSNLAGVPTQAGASGTPALTGPTIGGGVAQMPRTSYQGFPTGVPRFGHPARVKATPAPDYGMGHNLIRLMSMLRMPQARTTI